MKEQMQIPLSLSHTTHHLPNYVQTPHPKTTTSPTPTHSPRPTPLRLQEPPGFLIPLSFQDGNHGLRALTSRLGPMLWFVLCHMSANNLQPHAATTSENGSRKTYPRPQVTLRKPRTEAKHLPPLGSVLIVLTRSKHVQCRFGRTVW